MVVIKGKKYQKAIDRVIEKVRECYPGALECYADVWDYVSSFSMVGKTPEARQKIEKFVSEIKEIVIDEIKEAMVPRIVEQRPSVAEKNIELITEITIRDYLQGKEPREIIKDLLDAGFSIRQIRRTAYAMAHAFEIEWYWEFAREARRVEREIYGE